MVKKNSFEWRSLLSPASIVFLVALINYVWFFSVSNFFEQFGTSGTKISFCLLCPWYWDWSFTNLPSLSLLAATFLLLWPFKGPLVALLIGGFQIVDGVLWLSKAGFLRGVSQRAEVYSESDIYNFWSLLDVQYFLALAIFLVSCVYLVKAFGIPKPRSGFE